MIIVFVNIDFISVPEKSLVMKYEKVGDDMVVVNCTAEGLFPEPNMTILADRYCTNFE